MPPCTPHHICTRTMFMHHALRRHAPHTLHLCIMHGTTHCAVTRHTHHTSASCTAPPRATSTEARTPSGTGFRGSLEASFDLLPSRDPQITSLAGPADFVRRRFAPALHPAHLSTLIHREHIIHIAFLHPSPQVDSWLAPRRQDAAHGTIPLAWLAFTTSIRHCGCVMYFQFFIVLLVSVVAFMYIILAF